MLQFLIGKSKKRARQDDDKPEQQPASKKTHEDSKEKKEIKQAPWSQVGVIKFKLKDGSPGLMYLKDFMSREWADRFFKYFRDEIKWQHTQIFVAGKWQFERRHTAAFSKYGSTYTYNRKTVKGLPYTRMMWILDLFIKQVYGINSSFIFFNKYRTSQDRIGDHQDDETDLDPDFPIISGSNGATRVLQIKQPLVRTPRNANGEPIVKKARAQPRKPLAELVMVHGSCTVMFPRLHQEVTHGVPIPQKHHPPATATIDGQVTEIRFNWTARCLKADKGKSDTHLIPRDLLGLKDILNVTFD